MIDFTGRVAIVTGAGRGIGRETALALARRGSKILVNDYGGGGDTLTPGTVEIAQSVVDEIRAEGGQAEASTNPVGTGADAGEIVAQAMAAFGRIDILINNAGGSLGIVRMNEDSDAQAEGVLRTNLIGPYLLSRRVWPIMQAQGYGRIVNIMSGAMLGMVGTSAYSTAKSGLIGLTNSLAIEGAEHGIHANGVWPVAFTRLAGKLEDEATYAWMQRFPPHFAAEGIVFLSSAECTASGEMFTVGGGHVARNAIVGNQGFHDTALTAESLAQGFEIARDMSEMILFTNTADENRRLSSG